MIPKIISIIPIIKPAIASPFPLALFDNVSLKANAENIVEATPQGTAKTIIPTKAITKPDIAKPENLSLGLFSSLIYKSLFSSKTAPHPIQYLF